MKNETMDIIIRNGHATMMLAGKQFEADVPKGWTNERFVEWIKGAIHRAYGGKAVAVLARRIDTRPGSA